MFKQLTYSFGNTLLRELKTGDAATYFELIESNRADLILYFPTTSSECKSAAETIAHIEKRLQLAEDKIVFTYVIVDLESGKIIGSVILKEIVWNVPKAEFAYFIDQNYSGKGIVSHCVKALCEHYFTAWKFNKLYMRISPENQASKRVAEKNGFVYEGLLRNDFRSGETLIDVAYYGLIPKRD